MLLSIVNYAGKIGTLSDSDEKNRYKWHGFAICNLEKQRQVQV